MIRLAADGTATIWWQSTALCNYKFEMRLDAFLAVCKTQMYIDPMKAAWCELADIVPLTQEDVDELRAHGVMKGKVRSW